MNCPEEPFPARTVNTPPRTVPPRPREKEASAAHIRVKEKNKKKQVPKRHPDQGDGAREETRAVRWLRYYFRLGLDFERSAIFTSSSTLLAPRLTLSYWGQGARILASFILI